MTIRPLDSTRLGAYLKRIGHDAASPRPDQATLDAVVKAHVQAIPFENIDVQMGQPLTTDADAAFDKLVARHRGGWCYEHNGLLGAALAAMGFQVTRISAGVMRQVRGDECMGTHLCLRVECGGAWLVDAGFGSWLGAPVPLEEGDWTHAPYPVILRMTDDGHWRISVGQGASAMSYDFREEPADEEQLSRLCQWQASHPDSIFVQNLAVQRRDRDRYLMLRGKVLSCVTQAGEARQELVSADDLVETLRTTFLLDTPEAARLWPAICARHEALFGVQAEPTT